MHQQGLQSILWHFEEEQKQLKSVLGNLESKAVQRSGDDAKHELQTCSQELEAQLGRLRSVLKVNATIFRLFFFIRDGCL